LTKVAACVSLTTQGFDAFSISGFVSFFQGVKPKMTRALLSGLQAIVQRRLFLQAPVMKPIAHVVRFQQQKHDDWQMVSIPAR